MPTLPRTKSQSRMTITGLKSMMTLRGFEKADRGTPPFIVRVDVKHLAPNQE